MEFVSGLYDVTRADDWAYSGDHGPTHWPGLCAIGKKQSPVNIISEDTIKTDLGALKFIRYDFAFSGTVTNNGHSVQIQLDGVPIHLEGGDLPSTYILEQLHFHWPAEHTVDGTRAVLELHFVHYDNQYENVTVASQHENGIAVVATLFKLHHVDNMDLMPIVKATELVSKWVGKSTAMMRSKLIPFLLLPKDHTTYYRYDGSLTTPQCRESVMWMILTEKLTISEQQLNIFKHIGTSNGILDMNYRPTQILGERKVYHHLEGYSSVTCPSSNLFLTLFSFLFIKVLFS
ncbi:PREDICTED: putative carbonic anhydrase 3 [Dufourea novaeangliae]|uniref:putative carbonic anhydrase 3 n=1 Tax=Dufourea novaeangliae TaxID=178035 RepID=UPI000766E73C|nr:PREDICTED: putative carbonic anhydrase 3 [Dufourea novaeangliae]